MRWFGFGFNAFGQICVHEKLTKEEASDVAQEVTVIQPTELRSDSCPKTSRVRACWSRRASVHLDGESVGVSDCNSSGKPYNYAVFVMVLTRFALRQVTAVCAWQVSVRAPPGSPVVFVGKRVAAVKMRRSANRT